MSTKRTNTNDNAIPRDGASLSSGSQPSSLNSQLIQQVAKKERRKIRERSNQDRSVWFGLGMFGLVGWSIAIPTLIGIAIGAWIDRTWQHDYSCTLMSMFVGVVIGCSVAWYWVKRESLAAEESNNGSPSDPDTPQRGTPK